MRESLMAYIDPGTGGMLIQIIGFLIFSLVSSFVLFKQKVVLLWKEKVSRKQGEKNENDQKR